MIEGRRLEDASVNPALLGFARSELASSHCGRTVDCAPDACSETQMGAGERCGGQTVLNDRHKGWGESIMRMC